jgi:ribose/xylose/arabinose/galactoside ABC-type transport system permease subunit
MQENVTVTAERVAARGAISARLLRLLQSYGLWVVIALLLISAAIVTPGYLSPHNLLLVLRQAAPLGIVAIGQLLVILVAGLDLSVGELIATTAVVAGIYITGASDRILPAVAIVVGIGLGVGLLNGVVITKRRVEPFIMTLATMIILRGFEWNYSGGAKMGMVTPGFREIALGYVGPIPVPVLIWLGLLILTAIVFHKTAFGRQIYATGGNREAARLSGVRIDLVVIACYVICSLLAVLAGLMLLAYVGVSDSSSGNGYELASIAAVVIGGASFAGGRGTIEGNLAGVLILTLVGSLLNAFSVPWYGAQVVRGLIIIAAVAWYMRGRVPTR